MLSGVRGGLAVGDARRLGLLRRGVRLVARHRRDHDAHRAAGNAQGRLRRRACDRLHSPPAAALDILIPPSIILVIYAAIAEQSVPKLFAAGLVPGLVLTALYMVVALAVANVKPHYAPDGESVPLARADRRAARALAVPRAVRRHHRRHLCRHLQPDRGGLDRRRSAPSCSASSAAGWAVATLLRAIENSVATSGVLFVIVIGANLFSFFIVQTQLPDLLADGAQRAESVGDRR